MQDVLFSQSDIKLSGILFKYISFNVWQGKKM